ncbi:hypothetical protein F7725_001240 [Dissostichus mawsoni]|uniref:C-type lectin domain-containing protein n=1 Tax=Dissostichus mawsoni TaxID=36200 RepID=A0A7J5ZGQ9_DISMA|nr:hypothetical protein F7725_001240 [Dissostichus mawsoni]
MEEVYANIDDVQTLSSKSSTIQEGPRRFLRASALGLGLLSVFLLAGLIGLTLHHHDVTEERERLKVSLTEKTSEVFRLQCLMKRTTCPEGWRKFGCSCYLLSTEKASWEQSRHNCTASGADLVIVNSSEEQLFVFDVQSFSSSCFPVMPVRFRDATQPDNGGADPQWGEEDCAHISIFTNGWNDQSCRDNVHWICEKEA